MKSVPQSLKTIFSYLLKIGVTALLFYLIMKNDPKATLERMQAVPLPCLAGALLLIAAQVTLTAFRWMLLLRIQGIKEPFGKLLSLTYQGCFFALALPGGVIGGDVIKAGLFLNTSQEGERFNGVFSIFMDRFCGMISLFLLVLIVPGICFERVSLLPGAVRSGIGILMLCAAGALVAALGVFFHDALLKIGLFRKMFDFLDRYSRGGFANAAAAVKAYRAQWKMLIFLILLGMVVMFPLLMGGLILIAKGILPGIPVSDCVLTSTISNMVGAMPLTPGGLGTRDYVSVKILGGLIQNVETANAATVLYTALLVLNSLFGGIFFLFSSLEKRKSGKSA